jgi:hypothetical protein
MCALFLTMEKSLVSLFLNWETADAEVCGIFRCELAGLRWFTFACWTWLLCLYLVSYIDSWSPWKNIPHWTKFS